MVKQYKDGYFENGKWVNGIYHQQEPILRVDVIDRPHLKPIKVGDRCNDHLVYSLDNAWSTGDYTAIEEPCDVQYITYLFYAIAFLVVLAILFIIFA